MKVKSLLCAILCAALILLSLCSCKEAEPKVQAESYYDFFDTVSVIMSYKDDTPEEFAANAQLVYSVLKEYHRLFDIYYEYEGVNNLKTVNKSAGKSPVKVDRKLVDFLLYCKDIYALTAGQTNVAMGSVLKLWHDERESASDNPENAKIPDNNALSAAAEHTDINAIIIDENACTVFISDPKVQLDVGAIGKGYATEKAAEALIGKGVSSYVLNIGGNLRAIGAKPSGNAWTTGITNPDKFSSQTFVCEVNIKNTSLVTSGDYERYYLVNGERYHHIIDPETLMPATHFSSVSVFVENSALADALSTALFCMSYEEGLELVKSINAEAIWVTRDGKVSMTDGVDVVKK